MKKRITLSWSGGKDSAFALYKILQSDVFEVVGLHTVLDAETKRVSMHGVHEGLIIKQAEALALPLTRLYLDSSASHDAYVALMHRFYDQCAVENICYVVFGDIFLEDLRQFRENLLGPSGLFGIFPLWKTDSKALLLEFLNAGFKTLLCAADTRLFNEEDMGKTLDAEFLEKLPASVDPCGEHGEFHTFVYDGPVFKKPVAFKRGGVVKKVYSYEKKDVSGSVVKTETAFWFQDLLF